MLINNLVTRFQNGVNAHNVGNIFNSIPFPDALNYHIFNEDFYTFVAAQWTATAIGTSTAAAAAGNGGLILLTTGATLNNGVQIQRLGAGITTANVVLDPTKQFFFEAIVNPANVALATFAVGLAITDTTVIPGVTDGLLLTKATGGTAVTAVATKDSVSATAQAGTAVVGENRLQMYYDGQGAVNGRLYAGVNGVIGGFAVAGPSIVNDENIVVTVAIRTDEAVAKTMTVDRIFFAQER